MWQIVGGAILALVVLVVGGVRTAGRRLERQRVRLVDSLLEPVERGGTLDLDSELDGLPDPVRRYFETVLEDGRPFVRTVRLTQHGEFRLGDPSNPWRRVTATQHMTVDPPGFVWDANISMAPFVTARVLDGYRDGRGRLEAKIFSWITVADAARGPELDEGELLRYLAEAPWLPTALLPSAGVSWREIDEHRAEATLVHDGTEASLEFTFGENGLIETVHTDARPRDVDGRMVRTPWTGYFDEYQDRDGMLVPHWATVEWNLEDGDFRYFRATVEAFEYDV